MLNNLRTVDKWYNQQLDESKCLTRAFYLATDNLFGDVWIPILLRDSDHSPHIDDNGNFAFTYQNVGFSAQQLADAYWTLYARNMLVSPLNTKDFAALSDSVNNLSTRIKSVFLMNKYKYKKWIDIMGYAYNPLWNVDGTESYQFIDKHGNVTNTNTPILTNSVENQTSTYDSTAYRADTKQINTYSGTQSTNTETRFEITTDSITGPVHNIVGGDFSHIEKRIRQGNIGVTETTALLTHERELVRFNLIQEFFDDINKQILIGIFCMKG